MVSQNIVEAHLSVSAYPWRGLLIISSNLTKSGQQITGLNLRVFVFLARVQFALGHSATPTPGSCTNCELLSSNILYQWVHIVGQNQSTGTHSTVTSAARFQCGMYILSAGEHLNWPCVDFLSFLFVLSIASEPPLHLKMRQITPTMHSYLMFRVEKCVLTEFVSRRIPHLNQNIQETFGLRHAQMVSQNIVGAHLSVSAYPWRGLLIISSNLTKIGQQITGLNLRFFAFLTRVQFALGRSATPTQGSCSNCEMLSSNILLEWVVHIVGQNQSTETQSCVISAPRFQCGMYILSAGEHLNWSCADFLSFLCCTSYCFTATSASQNATDYSDHA